MAMQEIPHNRHFEMTMHGILNVLLGLIECLTVVLEYIDITPGTSDTDNYL